MVLGVSGTIGTRLADLLRATHEVIGVSRRTNPSIDLTQPTTIDSALHLIGEVDAVICVAAHGALTPVQDVSATVYDDAIRAKLLGQLHLVHVALRHLSPGGSITLTSGRSDPAMTGAAVGASINIALETYVELAAAELGDRARLNVVSPGWVSETLAAMGRSPVDGTPAAVVAQQFRDIVLGEMTGTVVR